MDIHFLKIVLVLGGVCTSVALFVLLVGYLLWRDRRNCRYSPFTENFFRLPGHSTRLIHDELVEDIMWGYLIFVITSAFVVWNVVSNPSINILVLFAILVMCYLMYRTYHLYEKAQKYRLGCEGEEFTGQELNLLMLSGAYVFHDIPYKYGNIDHIVVGKDKLFVVETKAFEKPQKAKTEKGRDATVRYDGNTLFFPKYSTSKPLEQVKMAADFVENVLLKKTGEKFQVIPVVALPGWFVEQGASKSAEVLVINPKRGKALKNRLGEFTNYRLRQDVVRHIAAVSRTIKPKSKISDPNAADEFDFWSNPKPIEDLSWNE